MATQIENPDNLLCDYGCGEIAKFQLKNGKLCCSNNISKCLYIKNALIQTVLNYIKIENPDNLLCDYGCGEIAKFQFKNGKLCCSDNFNKCSFLKNINVKSKIGIKKSKGIRILNPDGILCDHGCGEIAKFQFKNGKFCCSDHTTKCLSERKKYSKKMAGRNIEAGKKFENPDNLLCDYGCGEIAKFQFKNGKLCCRERSNKCLSKKEIHCFIKTGKKISSYKNYKNPDNLLCDYGCGEIAKFQLKNGKYCCSDHFSKCSGYIGTGLTYEIVKERYKDLVKIEGIISGSNGEILGHCKNSKCKNSKENGGYFELTTYQIIFRNREIFKISDGNYFYCCEECKQECPLYRSSAKRLIERAEKDQNIPSQSTQQDLSYWRTEVIKRQLRDNPSHTYNFCEICHSTEDLHVHHIQPQKLEPGYALDPPNGMILCQECHSKHGHKIGTECSTGNLANKFCK